DLVGAEEAHADQQHQRGEEERGEGERQRQRELPLLSLEIAAKAAAARFRVGGERYRHFAISLLNFSIQAARSGLICAQSWFTYLVISSMLFIGRSAPSGTSLLTGRKLSGSFD